MTAIGRNDPSYSSLKPVGADSSIFIVRKVDAKRTTQLVDASMIQFKQILWVIAQGSLAIR